MVQFRRRQFLIATGVVLAVPFRAEAQRADHTHRVAFILTTSPIAEMAGAEPAHPIFLAFVREMRTLGYVEGRNLALERRSAEGRAELYQSIGAELVQLKTDVIVTAGGGAQVRRVRDATGTIPIVMLGSSAPEKFGLAQSLARPGGNVTGLLASAGYEMGGKRLQLLKEALPRVARVSFLGDKAAWEDPNAESARRAAKALDIELLFAEHLPENLEETFATIKRQNPDALLASGATAIYAQREKIVAFARMARLPDAYLFAEMAVAGGLMSYGVNAPDLGRRAAHYVDKILKGAKPGGLPIEQPVKFDFIVNLGTARSLGITIPQSVLVGADRVIE